MVDKHVACFLASWVSVLLTDLKKKPPESCMCMLSRCAYQGS
uniref:Uncharacterized protein n=1 Tax=Arundo donax TaxID=35708 RepID=A0A0A9BNX0_ARUDO